MKERISRQIITLLRDMLTAMRSRDEELRAVKKELSSMESKLDKVLANQSDVIRKLGPILDDYDTEKARVHKRLQVLEAS